MTAMQDDAFWQTKLHARLHDPAEKALVLLRDPAGHEGGTSRALHRDLGFHRLDATDRLPPDHPDALGTVLFKDGIPVDMYRLVKRADWWASAADRPQWPWEEVSVPTRDGAARTRKIADWAQVRWTNCPMLVHPLSGRMIDLGTLRETEIGDIKERSRDHFSRLIVRDGDAADWRRTALSFWRFGPELVEDEDSGKLGALWPLLPADTRVPDHTIWDHLDLTSAFAGAFTADAEDQASLLAVAIGPVQGFIAAARTTSDLWAGSHLLSRMVWEALRVVCERLGPDAVLFPRLRGLPQVDKWLRDDMKLEEKWFSDCLWTRSASDANPLFAAALPNRFVAVVPKDGARNLANEITRHVREWLQKLGRDVVRRLLDAAGIPDDNEPNAYRQMREQLVGFPEVHWSATPFSLVSARNRSRDTDLDVTALAEAMRPFFPEDDATTPGFLGSPAWAVLARKAELEGVAFFEPNPGVLYPAIHDLGERVLAAAKAARPFDQLAQNGWRCSLTGETEWLSTDAGQLNRSYRGRSDTLWARVAERKPAWAKAGEHLGGLAAVKRLWPTIFAEEVDGTAERFVVSTHTMALAGSLERLHEALSENPDSCGKIKRLMRHDDRAPALPRKLRRLRKTLAARIPAALERLRESDGDESELKRLESLLTKLIGQPPESYYALLLFDGDHMGRILAGQHDDCSIPYVESFHPAVRAGFGRIAQENPSIRKYGEQRRAVSPNRHLAISTALNDFALHVVPHIVEVEYRGRVIYAGGDDVMAMLPVADLLAVMRRLREAYSGEASESEPVEWSKRVGRSQDRLVCRDGFALVRKRLMRMMGGATASCGAVVAHHQTPLAAVLRELRASEQRAKKEGGRNAFSMTILKRAGGDLRFTAKWGEPDSGPTAYVGLLGDCRSFLAGPASRRAVYNTLVWLRDLPNDADAAMLDALMAQQFARQLKPGGDTGSDRPDTDALAGRLAALAVARASEGVSPNAWLGNFLGVAEFLAREGRTAQVALGHDGAPNEGP